MSGVLPHSAVLHEHLCKYLDELSETIAKNGASLRKSSDFRAVFKNSTAAAAVLDRFAARGVPLLESAAGSAARFPLHVACGQMSMAYVDLRRFVDLIVWSVYFMDHPVEFRTFATDPGRGFARPEDGPIAFCARRETRWYLDYCRDLFRSGAHAELPRAAERLSSAHARCSSFVHPVRDSLPGGSLGNAMGFPDNQEIAEFAKTQRAVLSASVLFFAALRPKAVSKLDAIERGWYDFLVGKEMAAATTAGKLLD